MGEAKLKFWGWGYEGQGPNAEQQKGIAARMAKRLGVSELKIRPAPRVEDLRLPAPRISPPDTLSAICSQATYDRALHSYGKSFRDLVRAFRCEFPNPPDVVAYPRDEADVIRVLEWCDRDKLAAIPFGGGSSVVGGVEPPKDSSYRGVVTINLRNLNRVLEIDRTSRAARIQAGVLGPHLEDQLRPHGLTLRHFPQSFEFSTLGGWIATRSGGHFATLYTHIDEFVEALRVITPSGIVETRRLPGSGAGPSPDRLFIGSEGTLGIITEAWMRLQDRPKFRAGASVCFKDFMAGARAVRAISQAGLYPANCRLLDPLEAQAADAGDGSTAVLVLAFESADHPVDAALARALECCADFGGIAEVAAEKKERATHEGRAGAWRRTFLNAPYVRDTLIAMSVITETFETAITWDRFEEFHQRVMEATVDAVKRVCGSGTVSCRFTHVYPDGPAPYYTVIALGREGDEIRMWDEIKKAASDTIISLGGTITHHHAVGRDHRPWYDKERPEGFARALRAAKRELDPRWILNPGVLIDPDR